MQKIYIQLGGGAKLAYFAEYIFFSFFMLRVCAVSVKISSEIFFVCFSHQKHCAVVVLVDSI
jgi:hypothetical protein